MAIRKFRITIDGKIFLAEVEEIVDKEISKEAVKSETKQHKPAAQAQPSVQPAVSGGKSIVSPMPGKVIKINVRPGESIQQGSVVLILEAMKMEQEIKASASGTVKEVCISEGDTVKKEQTLIIFE